MLFAFSLLLLFGEIKMNIWRWSGSR